MRTTFISTANMINSTRSSILRLQSELTKGNKEITTGRYADVGLELGYKTSTSVSLYSKLGTLQSLIDNNKVVGSTLETTQAVLNNAVSGTSSFLEILNGTQTVIDPNLLVAQASSALSDFYSGINTSSGGLYLFSGINSDSPPLNDFDAPGGLKEAIGTSFSTLIGSGSAGDISADDMKTFLDGDFAALFSDANWGSWSDASSTNTKTQIGLSETATTSASANEPVFRNVIMAYSMITELDYPNLSAAAQQVVLDKAGKLFGSAISDFSHLEARLGAVQNRIDTSTEVLDNQKTLVKTQLNNIEGIDVAEAKTRVDTLTTQIEMSYSLTANIKNLSILNYI